MLNEGRGLETAIRAMKLLPEDFRLILVGSGDVEQELKQLAIEEQVDGRVEFTGFVTPDQLPSYTNQAWLGLNLLENTGLSYYYSLANKAFDYIQSNVPSVQMAYPEYVALQEEYNCFVLLDQLEPLELAGRILQLAADQISYQQLIENNKAAAQDLCWENEQQRLLKIYQRVLADH